MLTSVYKMSSSIPASLMGMFVVHRSFPHKVNLYSCFFLSGTVGEIKNPYICYLFPSKKGRRIKNVG